VLTLYHTAQYQAISSPGAPAARPINRIVISELGKLSFVSADHVP
jgi:hypothetical protein